MTVEQYRIHYDGTLHIRNKSGVESRFELLAGQDLAVKIFSAEQLVGAPRRLLGKLESLSAVALSETIPTDSTRAIAHFPLVINNNTMYVYGFTSVKHHLPTEGEYLRAREAAKQLSK